MIPSCRAEGKPKQAGKKRACACSIHGKTPSYSTGLLVGRPVNAWRLVDGFWFSRWRHFALFFQSCEAYLILLTFVALAAIGRACAGLRNLRD
jgi:hypothetical protein